MRPCSGSIRRLLPAGRHRGAPAASAPLAGADGSGSQRSGLFLAGTGPRRGSGPSRARRERVGWARSARKRPTGHLPGAAVFLGALRSTRVAVAGEEVKELPAQRLVPLPPAPSQLV